MDGSGTTDRVDRAAACRCWRQQGITEEVAQYRNMIRTACREHFSKPDSRALSWYACEREYPPKPVGVIPYGKELAESDGITGLVPPDSWGELPDNASLQDEVSWVSANRLRVRTGANSVDLSLCVKAPSHSALAWMEVALLFPSKFVDVSVKATATALPRFVLVLGVIVVFNVVCFFVAVSHAFSSGGGVLAILGPIAMIFTYPIVIVQNALPLAHGDMLIGFVVVSLVEAVIVNCLFKAVRS